MKKVRESIIFKPNETSIEKKVKEETKNVPEKIKIHLEKISKLHAYVNYEIRLSETIILKDTIINSKDSSKVVKANKLKNKKIRQRAKENYKTKFN